MTHISFFNDTLKFVPSFISCVSSKSFLMLVHFVVTFTDDPHFSDLVYQAEIVSDHYPLVPSSRND